MSKVSWGRRPQGVRHRVSGPIRTAPGPWSWTSGDANSLVLRPTREHPIVPISLLDVEGLLGSPAARREPPRLRPSSECTGALVLVLGQGSFAGPRPEFQTGLVCADHSASRSSPYRAPS